MKKSGVFVLQKIKGDAMPRKNPNNLTQGYSSWVCELKKRYAQSQIKASIAVNGELIDFYYGLGRDIRQKDFQNTYGSGFYKKLSDDLRREIPNAKGFSPTTLKYAVYFYDLYKDFVDGQYRQQLADDLNGRIRPQLVDDLKKIPWGHHRFIIDSCKNSPKKAVFFVKKTIENNWSRSMLLTFLDTDLYEREGRAVTNFTTTLPKEQGDLARELTRDPYCFDFVEVRSDFEERELKDALLKNIEMFLMELGRGFAYMGREYRLQVGETEQFLDMLFYNTKLHCYVVVEVKTGKFEPAYIGQLSTYVVAVNHLLKTSEDRPTLGILVCKDKDEILAQYSLEGTVNPIAISEFELSKIYPKDFRSCLPSIKELEDQLNG
ncbi:MAG: PDDEXK nuclease domain-containing protein [Fibrobacter sp.]|nr:PDDEXK nuclease domain-containing protein [Fibrobacter sp.]